MEDEYNGWTNYATWVAWVEYLQNSGLPGNPQNLREYLEELISPDCSNETAKRFAYAFIAQMNFDELAAALNPEEDDET